MEPFHEQSRDRDARYLFIRRSDGLDFLAHYHDAYELFVVVSGRQKVGIANQEVLLQAGQAILTSPWTIHYYSACRPTRGFMLIFSPDLVGGRISLPQAIWRFAPDGPDFKRVCDLVGRLQDEMDKQKPYAELAACGLLNQLLLALVRPENGPASLQSLPPGSGRPGLMQAILDYLARHLHEPVSRSELARHFKVCPAHISRTFHAATGLSLSDYLARLRVDRALDQLRSSQESITDIAYNCGFASIRSFNRQFQRITGQAPRDLRRQQEVSP
ncbi:MAG: AraC family transcriptional regulator [Clostridiaceae bacterium]|nr:AraC family transcriptional regulator [Clostridiaceae bacterium]